MTEMDVAKVAESDESVTPGGGAAGGILSGIKVDSLTPDLIRRLSLPDTAHGVVITEVDPDSSAAVAGLRRGEVIEEVARQPIWNIERVPRSHR